MGPLRGPGPDLGTDDFPWKDGIRTIAKQIRVTLFETGDFDTPALPVTIRGPDGSMEQIEPAPVHLAVNSVLPGTEEQLKDLRPPADFSTPFWDRPAFLIIAGLVILGLLGASGCYMYRRSRRPETPRRPLEVDTRSPWEVAMQEFDRIARLDLPANGDLKEHYTLVSGALRTCLGATLLKGDGPTDAADMSTEEIGTAVRQSSRDAGNARAIIEILQEGDLVKFANYAPHRFPGIRGRRANAGLGGGHASLVSGVALPLMPLHRRSRRDVNGLSFDSPWLLLPADARCRCWPHCPIYGGGAWDPPACGTPTTGWSAGQPPFAPPPGDALRFVAQVLWRWRC